MGNRGEVSPGKLTGWQAAVRLIVVALALPGALLALAAALSPDVMTALLDSSKLPVFDTDNSSKFGELSVLLLAYVFLALSRYSDSDFRWEWVSWVLLLLAWFLNAVDIPIGGTLTLLLAVALLVGGAIRDKDRVWIWTNVPQPAAAQLPTAPPSPDASSTAPPLNPATSQPPGEAP